MAARKLVVEILGDAKKAYLDYNNRRYFRNVERCGRRLRDIAEEVASSFKGNWTSVSEFT